jgi:hypothetical protein
MLYASAGIQIGGARVSENVAFSEDFPKTIRSKHAEPEKI